MKWLVGILMLLAPCLAQAGQTRTMAFLGFSRNEKACAWRETVVQTQGHGLIDRYHLVRLVDTATNKTVAVYRESSIYRTDGHGGFVFTADALLSRDNPEWTAAAPRRAWLKVQRDARFRAVRLDFKDTLVRLDVDDDAQLQDVYAEDKTIEVEAAAGSPVGYVPVARLMNGALLPLGHFRMQPSGKPARVHAEVEVYHSISGKRIAILNHFHEEMGGKQRDQQDALVVPTPDVPIGSTHVGALQMLSYEAKSCHDLFKSMHPEGMKDWDEHMGSFF